MLTDLALLWKYVRLARSCGLVVQADGSWPRGSGFKPHHRILDGCKQFASYYIKEKLKIKVAKKKNIKNIRFKLPDFYRVLTIYEEN